VDAAVVSADGRVRLDEVGVARQWPSVADLATDYLRYIRSSGTAKEDDDVAAWVCVIDLVSEPAWSGAVDLIDELLRQAATEYEIGMIAAGPLDELVLPGEQGPRFIESIEARTHAPTGGGHRLSPGLARSRRCRGRESATGRIWCSPRGRIDA
jgi:hypothetical protein